ncbi:MAG: HD domain-containing protein [Candidatus Heimdallarchaeota archaeon]|nr:HD domain-containing protein [Candidatus Heimdallarchaeota archaeon]
MPARFKKNPKKQVNATERFRFIKDPCHGYIFINELDKDLIDTAVFQRLRRIKQLSGSEFVYPGANHTRFEHSLGVRYLAEIMAKSLSNDEDVELKKEEIVLVQTAALLHDIGHGPFSHTFEALLSKIGKHHEDFSKWLVEQTEIGDILKDHGYNPKLISGLIHGSKTIKKKAYLNQIISGACDVDKMDFIVRDSYHTGAEYGRVDIMRILYTMGVFEENLAVNYSALSALEAFLIARVESFRTIYFHKVSRGSQLMVVRAMELAEEELNLLDFDQPEDYLKLDDYSLWTMLRDCPQSKKIMQDLSERKLLKVAFEREFMTRDEFLQSTLSDDKYRQRVIELIAQEADVDPAKVFIDIPTLPSVPYSHSIDLPAYEIPMFTRDRKTKEKISVDIKKVSRIFEALMGMMYIFRVYTDRKEREKVRSAAQKVLGKEPIEKSISF